MSVDEATVQSPANPAVHRVGRFAAGSWYTAAAPVLLAFLVGAVVLLATGKNPLTVYGLLTEEAFGSWERIAATLTSATPLLFTGLATALAFRSGVFSMGVEGSFVAGGLAAVYVGIHAGGLPAPLAISVSVLSGLLAGMAAAAAPALLRWRWQVDEVVTTLMMNFIVAGITGWLVQSVLLAPGQANSATEFVSPAAELSRLAPPTQLNAGLILAVLCVLAYAVWMRRTPLGYESKIIGLNPDFAAAHGIAVRRVVLFAILSAGAMGGLGGGVHALGVVHRFVGGFSPGFGFTGMAIALLARFSPTGIIICAVLFGALASAGSTVQLFSDIPLQITTVLQGTVMMFAVAQFAVPRLIRRARRVRA